jgi:hypothetical protein
MVAASVRGRRVARLQRPSGLCEQRLENPSQRRSLFDSMSNHIANSVN